MSDFLDNILTRKREEIVALRRRFSEADLRERAAAAEMPRGFANALRVCVAKAQTAVIAEIKKASPSKGLIRADFDSAWLARDYAAGGAACLSVLTDEQFFQGTNAFLIAARGACALPVLRKDFLIDPLQVIEARALGADCVLLIAAALSVSQLAELTACALDLKLDVLVEIHNAEELAIVEKSGVLARVLLGINNRNLRTFATSLETTLDLLQLLPEACEVVTESGIAATADIARMRAAGVQRFLIGESLMRQPSPGKALRELLTAT